MKAQRIISYLLVAPLAMLLGGCSLMGLDLQEKYDYDYGVAYSNQLDINGWEFIQLHKSDFARFIDAVKYAEIDTLIFNRPGITIFPLMQGSISHTAQPTGTNGNPGGYWERNRYWVEDLNNDGTGYNPDGTMQNNEFQTPDRWQDYFSKEQVKQFILNHIVTMPVSFGEFLDMVPDGRCTFFPTMAESKYGYASLHMVKFEEDPGGGGGEYDRITKLYVNDFPSHFTKYNGNPERPWIKYFAPASPNIRTKNGSYIHVMNNTYLDFPKSSDMRTVPIWKKNDYVLKNPSEDNYPEQ